MTGSLAAPSFVYKVIRIIAVVSLVLLAWMTIDFLQDPNAPAAWPRGDSPGRWFYLVILGPFLVALGLIVIRRAPGNIIGLLLVIWGVDAATFSLRASTNVLLAALASAIVPMGWVSLFYIFSVFPTGRLPAPACRWQPVVDGALLFNLFVPLLLPFWQNELSPVLTISNPLYVPSLAFASDIYSVGGWITIIPLLVGLFVFPIWRYRKATSLERRQIRLVGFVGGLIVLVLLAGVVGVWIRNEDISSGIFTELYQLTAITLLPLAISVAILRHKLYDIDIIIRRTLIYTVLTTILGVVYFGGIVLTQQLFRSLTGQSSELAIVVSTLLIAALFAPLRRRVQDMIDRRLYRKKYDAEKVLADFQKNLREEVDMETLKANLIGVLEDTMQPTKIALWVKESPKSPTS
jgi:hypothetical protein